MIVINSARILEFKAYGAKSKGCYIEFLPDKSIYDGIGTGEKFAIFKYGGSMDSFVVTLSIKVLYSTKKDIDKDYLRNKLCEFARDLIDEELIDNIKQSLSCIDKNIF